MVKKKIKRTKIYCDGATNSFGSVFCVVLKKKGGKLVNYLHSFEKKISPIEAEYRAIICSLQISIFNCTVFTDSKTIYSCIVGKSKSKKYSHLVKDARALMEKNDVNLVWISRDENLAGIYLESRLNHLHETWKK